MCMFGSGRIACTVMGTFPCPGNNNSGIDFVAPYLTGCFDGPYCGSCHSWLWIAGMLLHSLMVTSSWLMLTPGSSLLCTTIDWSSGHNPLKKASLAWHSRSLGPPIAVELLELYPDLYHMFVVIFGQLAVALLDTVELMQ